MEKYLFKILKKFKYRPVHRFGGETECFVDNSEVVYTFNLITNKI